MSKKYKEELPDEHSQAGKLPVNDQVIHDDKAAKHSERKRTFCGLVIIIKNFNFINSRRPWPPNLISDLFHPGFFSSWPLLFYTRGVLVENNISDFRKGLDIRILTIITLASVV